MNGLVVGKLEPGSKIGRFEVLSMLGQGGMGAVYAARDPELGRSVAIKLILEPDTHLTLRLLREAQALAQLQHPNVVAIHDVGEHDEGVYIAMELVDGVSLDRLQPRPSTWREVTALFVQVGRGLAAAHDKGLVHRDVKPSNLLVGNDGRVRVGDFGLARMASPADDDAALAGAVGHGHDDATATTMDAPGSGAGSPAGPGPPATPLTPGGGLLGSSMTHAGAFLGTPRYMAPEQHQRRPATARSDQFSFCVAMWETLFGEHPFDVAGGNLGDAVVAGRRARPPRRRAPRWLVRTLERGLSVRPDDRWPSMRAFIDVLERTPVKRRRLAIAAGAVVVATAAVASFALRDPAKVDCGRAGDDMLQAWTPDARAAVVAAMASNGAGYGRRVDVELDGVATRWRLAAADNCRATRERGEQSPALLDRRAACLHRQLGDFAALTTALGRADPEAAGRALAAVRVLPDPASCSLAALSETPARRADPRAAEVEAAYARAVAAEGLDHRDEARREVEAAVTTARTLGDPALLARLLGLEGVIASATDARRARELLEEALAHASASRDPAVEAEAAIRLLFGASEENAHERLRALVPVARAALGRVTTNRPIAAAGAARLAYALGLLGQYDEAMAACADLAKVVDRGDSRPLICRCSAALLARRLTEAPPACRASLAAVEQEAGPRSLALATELGNLGIALNRVGDQSGAAELARRSLDIAMAVVGESSVPTIRAMQNLGNALANQGDAAATIEVAERGLRALDAFPGRTGTRRLAFLAMLSTAHAQLGKIVEARRYAEAAYAENLRERGPDHPELATSLVTLAEVYQADPPDLERCIDAYHRAAEHAERTRGPRTMIGSLARSGEAGCLSAAGRHAEARTLVEATLPDLVDLGVDPYEIAFARVTYGRALLGLGDEAGARAHLEQARAYYAARPDLADELRRVDQLMGQRRLRPR